MLDNNKIDALVLYYLNNKSGYKMLETYTRWRGGLILCGGMRRELVECHEWINQLSNDDINNIIAGDDIKIVIIEPKILDAKYILSLSDGDFLNYLKLLLNPALIF